MKKVLSTLLTVTMIMSFAACGNKPAGSEVSSTDNTEITSEATSTESQDAQITPAPVTIKQSPDKYTWYVKNYVGKNCASVGDTSSSGYCLDAYGAGYLQLVFVTADGSYIDFESEDDLKQYSITGQNLEPNTELKFTFSKDSEGNEYDNLVATQNYREIVLSVKKVKSNEENTVQLTAINPSPDKYTWYISDYVGRNLANCGYTSYSGYRLDSYGAGYLQLIFVSPDGAYIDPESDDDLKQYIVTGQNIEPNTELKFTFDIDSEGKEYDNLVATQSIENIVLSVRKIDSPDSTPVQLTAINPSPDKYTWYIEDYVGRNLKNCGYTSWGGDLMGKYGNAAVKLFIISEDGSFIDPEETDTLKDYVVTSQNISPNTELKLVFERDDQGVEYDNLVESQNIEEIEITVRPIDNN